VEWNRKILTGLGDIINYISIHRYWENSPDYYSFMGQSAFDFEEKIKVTADEIKAVQVMKDFRNPIYISVDEWGSFGRNFQSVLPIAQCLNSFIRHADVVKMTNFTMMTSLLNTDPQKGSFQTPLFNTFKLFSNNCRGNSVDTYVECDTFNTEKYKGIPFLDVTTVYSKEKNAVYINVINRHKDKAITTEIFSNSKKFTGKAEATVVNNDSLTEPFTYDKKDQYNPITKEINVEGNKLTYSFPAHSFVQIKVKVNE
jgi:alpha-N-arabinofuranosidase